MLPYLSNLKQLEPLISSEKRNRMLTLHNIYGSIILDLISSYLGASKRLEFAFFITLIDLVCS